MQNTKNILHRLGFIDIFIQRSPLFQGGFFDQKKPTALVNNFADNTNNTNQN